MFSRVRLTDVGDTEQTQTSSLAFQSHGAAMQRATRRAAAPLILLQRGSLKLFQGTRWGGKSLIITVVQKRVLPRYRRQFC